MLSNAYQSPLPRSRIQSSPAGVPSELTPSFGRKQFVAGQYGAAPFASRPYALGSDMREPQRIPLPAGAFKLLGSIIVLMLVAFPVYEAIRFLHNFNYVYWNGMTVPYTCIILCFAVVLAWFLISNMIFAGARLDLLTSHDIGMTVATLATVLGLVFLLVSMLGTAESVPIEVALKNNCATDTQIGPVRSWYAAAQALRATPECKKMYSIEECSGFGTLAAKQEQYLYVKNMEQHFQCQGFCGTLPLGLVGSGTSSSAGGAGNSSSAGNGTKLTLLDDQLFQGPTHSSLVSAFLGRNLEQVPRRSPLSVPKVKHFPPTLFSDANFNKVSCESAVAQDLLLVRMQIGHELWWQGIVLVASSVVIGFTDWISLLRYK